MIERDVFRFQDKMSFARPFMKIALLASLLLLAAPLQAADECKGWRNKAFWHAVSSLDARFCLAAGIDPNAQNDHGWTPLHWVAEDGDAGTLAALIEWGADPNARSEDGWTPLHWAAEFGNIAAVRALLNGGANPNTQLNNGETPLHNAAYNGDALVVAMLIDWGADPNAQSISDWTPLHWAAGYGDAATVSVLLNGGTDGGLRNVAGYFPFDLAEVNEKVKNSSVYRRLSKERYR